MPPALRHAYQATFGGQNGHLVLADLAAYAAVAGDGAGKMIAYIVSVVHGEALEAAAKESDGQEEEAA